MSETSSYSASSASSFSTGTGSSVISNENSDAGALAKLNDRDQDASIQDLLQQNKGFWDAAFSCLLLLTKNREVKGYRMLAFRVVFEYLQIFRLVFNTRFLWEIRTDLWIWKAIYWVLFRFLIWDMGYDKYVLGMYVICAVVLALAVLTIAVAVVLRKDDSSNVWIARLIWLLQSGSLLVFSICWVAVLDYLVFMFECSWGHGNSHMHWPELECIKMPHLANMVFGMAVALLTVVIVACLSGAECSGNLVSDNLMSSPVAETALKTTALKVIMVCVSTCLDELPKPQAVLMFICPCLSAYLQIRSSPYLLPWMNHLWTGLWASLVYTTGLQLVLHYYEPPVAWDMQGPGAELAFRESMTWGVLYGIFPAVLLGIGINWLVQRWKNRPLKIFEAASSEAAEGRLHTESVSVLKTLYKFRSPEQVAFLARCVRRFDPITDKVLPEAASVCNLIIQSGLARFPNNPTVLLVYANYIIHVKKEPRAARQQLQLAGKGEPSIFDKYAVFAGDDVLKRNRDQSEGGLDLMAYVEFQRNYRACVKAHKLALLAQRAFWRSLLHDSLNLTDMLASFKNMEAAEQTAVYVYKRVLERYPQNGKLLKVWGRFQEWVLHDPHRAARSYAEAIKRGLGDNMLNLTSDDAASFGMDTGLGKVDEKLDGVVIIDASGAILMANKVAYSIFGYTRGELDGKNVSILMPQPFSGKHDGFLHNYLSTGQAKILNSMRDVVALRKDRTIFPLSLVVTRLSGQGQESVFMGVLRVAEVSATLVRAWCTPTGTILCCDTKLEEWMGVPPSELTGRQVGILGVEPAALTSYVFEAAGPQRAAAKAGMLKLQTAVKHRYLQRIDVEVDTTFAGTEAETLLVLNFHSLSETQRVLVVDDKQRIMYASDALAKMLGVPRTQLTTLPSLVMHPCAHLHKVWFKEMGGTTPPFSSCRAGAIVPMIAGNGSKIPVRLEIRTVEQERAAGASHTGDDHVQRLHIVKVHKCTEEERLDSQSVILTVDQRGTVLQASPSPKNLFGFNPRSELIGRPLAAFINVFEEFRMQQQQQQGSNGSAGRSGAAFLGGSSSGVNDQYSKLAVQVGPGPAEAAGSVPAAAAAAGDDSMLLTLLAHAAQEGSEACYRVGVHSRVLQPEQIGQDRSAADSNAGVDASGKMSLLHVLGKRGGNQLRPALMRVEVVQTDWTSESADNQGMRFQVQLMVTEHMRAVLELDERLKVIKADPVVGQMLGLMSANEMRGQYVYKLIDLPADIRDAFSILKLKSGKASAMKAKHATQEVSVGPLMEVETTHADGQPVKLRLQAVGKEGTGNRLLLLRLKLAKAGSPGSLAALLHLCAVGSPLLGKLSSSEAAPKLRLNAAAAAVSGQRSLKLPAAADDELDEQAQPQGLRGPGHAASPRKAAAPRGLRFEEEESDGEAAAGRQEDRHSRAPQHQISAHSNWEQLRSPVVSGAGGALRSAALQDEGPARHGEGRKRFGSGAGGRGAPKLAPSGPGSYEEEAEEAEERGRGAPLLASALGEDVGGGLQGPTNDGASDVGSEDEGRLDIASASEAGDGDMDDEVTCDWRRAKRLRKILRQLESPPARGPLMRFWRGTWGVVAVLLLAHVVCYAVLASILTVRHTDVYGVQKLANAVDRSQMILLRANFIAKCAHVNLQHLAVCSAAQRKTYITKSVLNAEALRTLHTGVYLGSDPSRVIQLTDPKLRDWWTLPLQVEVAFYSTDPPQSKASSISLWNLGNRYINAARDVNYAHSVLEMEGDALEHTRFWQYVMHNGKNALYKAYAVSLDLYVMFCWEQLGGLDGLLTGLLIAELVAVAIAAMLFQLDSVRRVCKQRMACFGVFLALPSATLRSMATAPCQVDEDDANRSDDEDELDMMGGPGGGGGGQASVADGEQTGGAASKGKSVRMAVGDDKGTTDAAAGGSKAGKAKRLLDKRGSKDDTGLQGWARKKYRVVRHAAHGVFNRVAKINGKKLHPARATFAAFLLPLLAWWVVAIVIYGISFQKVAMLQAPLTSLQSAAHVQFNIARMRMLANMIGFLDPLETLERTELVTSLKDELRFMRSEYFSMLYGGPVRTVLEDDAPVYTTSPLFRSSAVSDLFFRTTDCLRTDPSTCYETGSPWYDVTHSGIDAMVQRLIQELDTFSKLPAANQTIEHSSYEYTWRVAANDLYEGLAQVSDAFVGTTMTALDELQQLHTYLLIATIVVFVAVVVVVLVPFRKRLMVESVRLAGLLSQLPQESDVEGQVKVMVIDAATGHKATAKTSQNWTLARGTTAAAGAAARAAASRAAGAVSNVRTRMAEASAAKAAAQVEAGGWQQYEQEDDDAESSQPDWT